MKLIAQHSYKNGPVLDSVYVFTSQVYWYMINVTTADLLVSGRHLCVQPPLLAGVGAAPLGPGVPHHLHLLLLLLRVVLHMFPGNLVFQWFESFCFTHESETHT